MAKWMRGSVPLVKVFEPEKAEPKNCKIVVVCISKQCLCGFEASGCH